MDTNTDRFSKRHPVSVVTLNELREKETKLLKRTDLEIKCQCNIDGYNNFVFLNKEYRVHNQNTLNRALERIVRKCNEEIIGTGSSPDPLLLPRIQCHMLRHTYGTRLNDAGVNVKAMQEMLGTGTSIPRCGST